MRFVSKMITGLALSLLVGGLVACDEGQGPAAIGPDHPTLQRNGCVAPPPGHGPNIISSATWSEMQANGTAWSVLILRSVPKQADGSADVAAIAQLVQRALNDLDADETEKIYASETKPIISMELDTRRAKLMASLDYVCAITDDRGLWPTD